MRRKLRILSLGLLLSGCDAYVFYETAPRFTVPLFVEGVEVGPAIIDTGGGYELILREPFGLEVVGSTDVLAFGGLESVPVTAPFSYDVAGRALTANYALAGVSVCDCNGLGFEFFRKTGLTLRIDFDSLAATFIEGIPFGGGAEIPFEPPPHWLAPFDTSFIEVEVTSSEQSRMVIALLDTGTNATVMRRSLFDDASRFGGNRANVHVAHPRLGTLAVSAGLFDTEGLPDLILGTDAMRAWAEVWYFSYHPVGGRIVADIAAAENDSLPALKATSNRPN